MIKNSISYSVVMPSTSNEMREFIDKSGLMSREPGLSEVQNVGVIPHPTSGDIVTSFEGGYCIVIRKWTKKIKPSTVNFLVNKKIQCLPVTKNEKKKIKDEVIFDLIQRTVPEPTDCFVYYCVNRNILIVDSATQGVADMCTSLLRKIIGSLKATTLYLGESLSLTSKVREHISNKGPHHEFIESVYLENVANLVIKGLDKEKISYSNWNLYDENIVELVMTNGVSVHSISLETEQISFNLSDNFKMKSIKFINFDVSYNKSDVVEWESTVSYCSHQICNVIEALVNEFTTVDEDS